MRAAADRLVRVNHSGRIEYRRCAAVREEDGRVTGVQICINSKWAGRMFLFDFFRSFLPLHNPIGFGASDFIELALAALLVLLTFARAEAQPLVQKLALRTGLCMLAIGALPVILRLALLAHAPVPRAAGSDDFI